MVETNPNRLRYSDPDDRLETLVSELAKIFGILTGIGIIPFLRGWLAGYWFVGVAVGLLLLAVGGFFILRRAQRQLIKPDNPPVPANFSARWRLWQAAVRSLLAALLDSGQSLVLLPVVVALIGVFIFAPAALTGLFQQLKVTNSALIETYFSAPAILVWIIGELVYVFPRVVTRPRHRAEIMGIARSILQILSGLVLWVFLGLTMAGAGLLSMLWWAIGLALVGLLCGLGSDYFTHTAFQDGSE